MIANTAISTATVLVLFKTYDTNAANEERKWCCPKLVKSAYDNLQEHITQYASGIPRIILGGFKGNIHDLMELFYASNSGSEKQRVGELLLTLTDPITDCKDFEDVAYGARERFTEFLLMDLVHQGFHIDTLLRDEFVDETEARFLGASENVIMQALAGINVEDAPDTNGGENKALQQPKAKNESNDPAVCMVMDVFPHYHVDGIKASLAYYNNDVEQFILDASMENLPPHLISQLTSDENVEEEAAPPGRHQERHLTTVDYDSVVPNGQLFSFLGKDLYDELLGSDDDEEEEDGENEIRYEMADPDYNTGMEDAFNIDESLKYKIRLLNEIMYEDEYDDAQLEDVRQGDVENGDDFVPGKEKVQSSSNAMPENQETKHTPNGPRSDYANKRFHENAAKERRERVKEIKKGREEDKPSYAKKQKTKKNAGGGKNAIARAAKKVVQLTSLIAI
ncbi:hypothetical protein AGDE_00873 [Angomonas deanei]|nr:hypothetical protein AGDE_00873 [Angomonas deanei]|eukprot:EPY43050.1 hypothetical protein AGDE_00873 [Angomonas deanei]